MSSNGKRFLLVHGSQTGQAQAIAEQISEKALQRGLQPELHCLSQAEKKFCLEKEPVFVVVVSTTGDGEPPDKVSKFWRKLKKKTVPKDHLSLCSYALLGLGDSNYTNFCNMGKMLNRRLLEVGAKQFYPPGFADDGVGLEIVVEPWIDGLWEPLESLLASLSQDSSLQPLNSDCTTEKLETRIDQDQQTSGTIFEDTKRTSSENDSTDASKLLTNGEYGKEEYDTKAAGNMVVVAAQLQGNETSTQEMERPEESTVHKEDTEELASKLKQVLTVTNSSESGSTSALQAPSGDLVGLPLTLPKLQPPYINVSMAEPLGQHQDFPYDKVTYGVKTSVSMATIVGRQILTQEGSVKKTIELEISLEECPDLNYQPGDAFGFVCPNDEEEVQWLLNRLKLTQDANKLMTMSIIPGTTKRNPMLSKHIPNPCSVVNYFTHCADIRCVPKKALLCFLASCCSNLTEARRLNELSSRQGAKEYTKHITNQHSDLLDVLYFFPSCLPPIERLIELLPRLQPRHYSAASSPLIENKKLMIAFNVETLPPRKWQDGRLGSSRLGLASGWFEKVTLSLPASGVKVPIFPRLLNPFHLPSDPLQPIVMIGPGTGVSPFIGFLQHREKLMADTVTGDRAKAMLFFGCRHPDKDFLFRDRLESFKTSGVLTHCHVCFSRLTADRDGQLRYVQDNMRTHWLELAQWIVVHNAVVYVCGDAENMAKDVHAALLEVITKYAEHNADLGLNPREFFSELKDSGRYLVDAWT